MIYLIDTNVFTRIAIEDSPKMKAECNSLVEAIRLGKIEAVTSTLVIIEFGWLLKSYYKIDRKKTAKLMAGIYKIKGLRVINDMNLQSAISLYESKNIDLTDALLATIPQVTSKEWTIVSYDEDFKKLPVLWKKPWDIIKS